jgi:dTDP-4-dehydrorhamnose reductase
VLHCAAYTDVDGAEREPERALEVNARGAEEVARRARAAGAVILYVSTDYVFDGRAQAPYPEDAPTRPLSAYGRSKLEGERRVAAAAPEDHVIARTGWLYGPGKGFVDWAMKKIAAGEELSLVEDQWGSPTSAASLAAGLLALVERDLRGVFHYVNQGVTSWLELGRALARELGAEDAVFRAIARSELRRPAPRPRYSALSVERYERATGEAVPTWLEALRSYLASKD